MSNELITVENLLPSDIFKTEKVTELLNRIEVRIKEFVPDETTKEGLKAIDEFSWKITKSKTLLEKIGDDYAKFLKEEPKKVDKERKRIKDTLEGWAKDVRKPVTDREEAEKSRIKAHEESLLSISQLTVFPSENPTVDEILQRTEGWKVLTSRDWEEFSDRSKEYFSKAHDVLHAKLATRKQYDIDQAELARLRKEKEEQDQKDRDAKLISDALAEKERQKQADADKAFQEINQPAPEPVKENTQTTTVYKTSLTAPISAPVQKDPRAEANNKAMQAFILAGFSEVDAKRAVILIASGKIPNVSINYEGEKSCQAA